MATEPTIGVLGSRPIAARNSIAGRYATALDGWALTKPEVNLLVVVATFVGFRMASNAAPTRALIYTLLGTLLVASGAAALNQFIERSFDAQMRRTSRRPLAADRLRPSHALWFGISLSVAGTVYLAAVNLLAALLAAVTLLSYLFLYTPLKRKTPLCVLVGAFPGAAPPLIGWAAARGRLDAEAWVLYSIIFLWQFPHVMAIAWMYRQDYSRAGYHVLPADGLRDGFIKWQSFAFSLALVPVALIPSVTGESGSVYAIGAAVLSLAFLCASGRFSFHRSNVAAKQLLIASILYLPLLFSLLLLDKR
jgi:heme o synthase